MADRLEHLGEFQAGARKLFLAALGRPPHMSEGPRLGRRLSRQLNAAQRASPDPFCDPRLQFAFLFGHILRPRAL